MKTNHATITDAAATRQHKAKGGHHHLISKNPNGSFDVGTPGDLGLVADDGSNAPSDPASFDAFLKALAGTADQAGSAKQAA